MSISVEIDTSVNAAYIQLSNEKVAKTTQLTEALIVDVDANGAVVGIELLDLGCPLEISTIRSQFPLSDEAIAVLRRLRPSLANVTAQASAPHRASALTRAPEQFERVPALAG